MLGFTIPERGDWEDQVSRALRGSTADDLGARTDDGLPIQPLYTEAQFPTSADPGGPTGHRAVHPRPAR